MLQDILAWNHARSTDIQRVNAMAASNLIPKDSAGNLKIPADVLDGLWRPFPGSPPSMTSITAMGGNGQQEQQQQPSGGATPPAPTSPSPTPAPLQFPWGKIGAAILAAALGSGGIGAGIISWLGNDDGNQQPPAATSSTTPTTPPAAPAQQPNYQVNETQYELRFGKLKGAN